MISVNASTSSRPNTFTCNFPNIGSQGDSAPRQHARERPRTKKAEQKGLETFTNLEGYVHCNVLVGGCQYFLLPRCSGGAGQKT